MYCTLSNLFHETLDKTLRLLNKNGFKVTVIHADIEFEPMFAPLLDNPEWSIELNVSAQGDHVKPIERANRTNKERIRAAFQRTPFRSMTKAMLVHMVESTVYKLNLFPLKSGVSAYYSPRQIVEKKTLSFPKHLKYAFGEYVMAPMETTNTPARRMVECIYLCPMYNAQGGHYLFNLQTQAIITRTVGLVQLPITPTVCQMVTDLRVKQGITKL